MTVLNRRCVSSWPSFTCNAWQIAQWERLGFLNTPLPMDQAPHPAITCHLPSLLQTGRQHWLPPALTHLTICVCAALEKKMAGRQGREELIKKGLLEMMEQGKCDSLHGGQQGRV